MDSELKEIIVSALHYTSWPVAVLIALWWFRKQIARAIANLRLFKAGSIEVGFREQIRRQGFTEAQLAVLKTLTAEEIDLFLLVSFTEEAGFEYSTTIDIPIFRGYMGRLESAGLMHILNPENDGSNLRHNITPMGRRIRALLVDSAVSLIQEDV